MRAIHISIGHNNNPVVPKLAHIVELANTSAKSDY